MTDTTLYAGLVGQKLHGTIRTNGLAYGGAMKSSKKIVVLGRIAFFVALLIAFFCFAAEAFVAGGVVIAATIVALMVIAKILGASTDTTEFRRDSLDQEFSRSMFSLSLMNPWNHHRRY
jgi:hypothetical protein